MDEPVWRWVGSDGRRRAKKPCRRHAFGWLGPIQEVLGPGGGFYRSGSSLCGRIHLGGVLDEDLAYVTDEGLQGERLPDCGLCRRALESRRR